MFYNPPSKALKSSMASKSEKAEASLSEETATTSKTKPEEVNPVRKGENGTLPGFEETDKSTKWQGDFYFICGADPQLGLITSVFAKMV